MKYPERPTLGEDGTNYLLRIHPKDRERAKSVWQCRFDWDRKCWVYPRTSPVFDALVAEFGDELDTSSLKPIPQEADGRARPPGAAKTPPSQEVLQARARQPAEGVDEIVDLKVQVRTLEKEKKELEDKHAAMLKSLGDTRRMVKRLEETIDAENAPEKLERLVKEIALEAAEQDREFAGLLERVEIVDMPIALSRAIENQCRKVLRIKDERVPLADLLAELRDTEVLAGGDAIDLAHVVRKQRNIAAHEMPRRNQRRARALLALMAASVVWPELRRAESVTGGR